MKILANVSAVFFSGVAGLAVFFGIGTEEKKEEERLRRRNNQILHDAHFIKPKKPTQ